MTEFSDGFAAPIIWGALEGYTPGEIAAGLEIEVETVLDVVASLAPPPARQPTPLAVTKAPPMRRRPRLLDVPARIDPARDDPQYLLWARARRGAGIANAGGPP